MGGETMAETQDSSSSDSGVSATSGGLPYRPEYMLTTFDNPFDPFTQWDEWYAWDLGAGYNTAGLLARLSYDSNDLSDLDSFLAIQNAIDEIVRENVSGMHKKVKRGDIVANTT
jgi:hypothetical protein